MGIKAGRSSLLNTCKMLMMLMTMQAAATLLQASTGSSSHVPAQSNQRGSPEHRRLYAHPRTALPAARCFAELMWLELPVCTQREVGEGPVEGRLEPHGPQHPQLLPYFFCQGCARQLCQGSCQGHLAHAGLGHCQLPFEA